MEEYMKALIMGNGVAGMTAAQELRKLHQGADLEIDVYTDEQYGFYTRVRLPDYVAGSIPESALFMHDNAWYEERNITVHTGCRITAIDRAAKKAVLASGGSVPYDVLIVTSGASANRPPIPCADADAVCTLRSLEDAKYLKKRIASFPSSAAVIGGGLLGLEAARGIKEAGAESVRVFEIADRLLPRQLDSEGSSLLAVRLAELGLELVTGVSVVSFDGGDGKTAVVLKDGRQFPVSTVLLSMGVHSNTDVVKEAGLTVGRGIAVDSHMRTDDPFIFAAGDCAEFGGIVWGIVPAALEQAPVAARYAHAAAYPAEAGELKEYVQTVPKTMLKIADVEINTLGKAVLSDEEAASGIYTQYGNTSGSGASVCYRKYVTEKKDGAEILCGAILYNERAKLGRAAALMNKPVTPALIDELLGI